MSTEVDNTIKSLLENNCNQVMDQSNTIAMRGRGRGRRGGRSGRSSTNLFPSPIHMDYAESSTNLFPSPIHMDYADEPSPRRRWTRWLRKRAVLEMTLVLLFVAVESIKILMGRWSRTARKHKENVKADIWTVIQGFMEAILIVKAVAPHILDLWKASRGLLIRDPFVRWNCEHYYWFNNKLYYCLYTADNSRVPAAEILHKETNSSSYKATENFVKSYREILPLGDVLEWELESDLHSWLDAIVYHSFVRYSAAGVGSCWYLHKVTSPIFPQMLPLGLRQFFRVPGKSTWVIFKHGSQAWPIEVSNYKFRQGWPQFRDAHQLTVNCKVILGCERKWIFTTTILGEHNEELHYEWSGHNPQWLSLHPTPRLCTACLPSILENQAALLKFGILYESDTQLAQVLRANLCTVFSHLGFNQGVRPIKIRMSEREWTIQLQNQQLRGVSFGQFIHALDLQYLDYILVVILATIELRIVVFSMVENEEKLLDWF